MLVPVASTWATPDEWHNADSPPPQCPYDFNRNPAYPTCLEDSGDSGVSISAGVSVSLDANDPSGEVYFIDISPTHTQFDATNFANVTSCTDLANKDNALNFKPCHFTLYEPKP